MLYKFRSKAAGDLIMLGPTGDQLLRIIGKEPAPKGIIEPVAMPAAIAALEKAVADEEAVREQAESEGAQPRREGFVSLRQRAWPLVEMLRRAHDADKEIVWGV
ncbi:MAG TPA: DUF1840 domain-containing protein [Burkholderiaceae bacterium]|jgi:hypothetical protein|nr:DUF1840 domain-containing protein [Burkholderiaceae bacterium]